MKKKIRKSEFLASRTTPLSIGQTQPPHLDLGELGLLGEAVVTGTAVAAITRQTAITPTATIRGTPGPVGARPTHAAIVVDVTDSCSGGFVKESTQPRHGNSKIIAPVPPSIVQINPDTRQVGHRNTNLSSLSAPALLLAVPLRDRHGNHDRFRLSALASGAVG